MIKKRFIEEANLTLTEGTPTAFIWRANVKGEYEFSFNVWHLTNASAKRLERILNRSKNLRVWYHHKEPRALNIKVNPYR